MAKYLINSDRPYHEKARAALPLLVRQAEAGQPIYYSDLADELSMPNPRNLNYPLGAIGNTLNELSAEWNEEVPRIQTLVISKATGIPGAGIGDLLDINFARNSRTRQREIVKVELQKIFLYSRWSDVLNALQLQSTCSDYTNTNIEASGLPKGEGENHRKLKYYVANNPSVLGPPAPKESGKVEMPLPSGDSLDVSFDEGSIWVAAEVKTIASPEADLARGIFQCVKYSAVMQAVQVSQRRERNVRVVLVLEGKLPQSLVALKNMLGVEVIEGVFQKNPISLPVSRCSIDTATT